MTTYTSVFGGQTIPPAWDGYSAVTLTADTQFYWPQISIGNSLVSGIMDVTSTGSWALIMPDARLVSNGQDLIIRNVGSSSFELKDFSNSSITTIAAGAVKYLYLTNNSTAGGTWGVFTFGTGTSGADAVALAGAGLKAIGNTLNQEAVVISSSVSSAVQTTYRAHTLVYTPSSGGVTATLPQASVAGDGFFFNLSNQGTGNLVIDPFSTELIDGATTKTLAPAESCIVVSNGSQWYTVGFGRSTQFQFTKLVFDLTSGGPFTLTSVQAQNKLIEFIGTIVAPVIVNVPAVVAVYYVQNDYSGAFNVTFKTPLGTGVVLLPGDRIILSCDGVNVSYAQSSSLPAANILGGSAGTILYQVSVGITGFTSVGTTGQFLTSGGTGIPTWTSASAIPNTPAGNISAVTLQGAINELDTEKVPRTALTGSALLPVGTTGQRDGSPVDGMIRYNQTLLQFEGYFNGLWQSVGGGQLLGNAATKGIFYNAQTISENLTVAASTNAMSAGPITIADGFSVTVANGSVWSII